MSSDSVSNFGSKPREQERVEETKYEAPREVFIDEGPPLPQQYGVDKIRLHVQDPHTVTAQWELTGGALDAARSMPRNPHPPMLRLELTDLTRGRTINSDITSYTDNWWFKTLPDTMYKIRIGLAVGEQVRWLAESNVIRTPRNAISDALDVQWMMVSERFREMLKVAGFDEKRYLQSTMGGSMGMVSQVQIKEALFSGGMFSGILLSGQVFGSLNLFGGASGQNRP
jgi:hypothetical protein